MAKYGMAIGADTSQGAPGDALEYSASAGGAAFIIGTENVVAEVSKTLSYTTDTPDFWRREGQIYPTHAGRFTGAPAYFKHIRACAERMMAAEGTKPEDYDYAIFHQPNGKFPLKVAKDLGFSKEQVAAGLLTPSIGNTYSGAVPLGLAAVLDEAKAGDRILVVSYGSGAGSDGFDIAVTDAIESYPRAKAPTIKQLISRTREIDYATYAKYRDMIKMRGD
jgi:hydroxymethylglutaryl-CoA synthase